MNDPVGGGKRTIEGIFEILALSRDMGPPRKDPEGQKSGKNFFQFFSFFVVFSWISV